MTNKRINAKDVENDFNKQRERRLLKKRNSVMILNYKYLRILSFKYDVTTFI